MPVSHSTVPAADACGVVFAEAGAEEEDAREDGNGHEHGDHPSLPRRCRSGPDAADPAVRAPPGRRRGRPVRTDRTTLQWAPAGRATTNLGASAARCGCSCRWHIRPAPMSTSARRAQSRRAASPATRALGLPSPPVRARPTRRGTVHTPTPRRARDRPDRRPRPRRHQRHPPVTDADQQGPLPCARSPTRRGLPCGPSTPAPSTRAGGTPLRGGDLWQGDGQDR